MAILLLDGKAKEDFLVHIYYSEDTVQARDENDISSLKYFALRWLDKQDERFINTLIIDWFDSVDIHAEFYKYDFFVPIVNEEKAYDPDGEDFKPFETRQEAVKQAIIASNEIYNKR